MPEILYIRRATTETPFGFKLQGGADFAVPLSVINVTPGSISDQAGLRPGDAILKINDIDTSWMEHNRAKMELLRCGNEIKLTIERNAVELEKPDYTPMEELRNQPQQQYTNMPPPPAARHDFTVKKDDPIRIGQSHNRAPMPFHRDVGSKIVYQAVKPDNWQAGDYTKWMDAPPVAEQQGPQQQQHHHYQQHQQGGYHQAPPPPPPPQHSHAQPPLSPHHMQQHSPQQQQQQQQQQQFNPYNNAPTSPSGTAVFHNPYNSPIGLYSDQNIMNEFQNQTRGVMPPPSDYRESGARGGNQPGGGGGGIGSFAGAAASAAQHQHSPNYLQQLHQPGGTPRGSDSLSMRMLNRGIEDASASNAAPPSVFDLKRGHNPSGAVIPQGFRSVMAPTALPPEQRHAPMRTEYQAQHVKQNWIEPKFH